MGANESISPVGSHRSIAAKRISSQSGKLARRCLRTDSQMSIFHDIMLPSDEVSEDSGLVHSSPLRLSPKHKPLSAMSSLGRRRRSGFQRASSSLSWSTTFNNSSLRRKPPPRNYLERNRSTQSSVSRRPVIGGGGGGGTMREAALLNNTSIPPFRNASQTGAGEFQRMTSLVHLMRLKGIGSNSSNNGNAGGGGGGNEDSFDSSGSGYFSGLPRSASRNSSFDDGVGSVKIGLGGGKKTGIFRSTSTDSSLSQVYEVHAIAT